MGNSFRPQPFPTEYGENKTSVSEDLLDVGFLVAAGIIAFSFILIIPGIRGWERLWATVRVSVALWVGTVILLSNFGSGWYTDTVCTRTQYKAHVFPPNAPQEIQAEVGLHIGLRGTNITLVEKDCSGDYERPFPGEEIDYNEQYFWADPWPQGRIGFGEFGGRYSQEFRAAQFRGTPYPILWVAEYFTLDGDEIRWGRRFRVAGWYTHIFLWTAFATYLVAIILYIFNIRLGAWFTLITGLLMILAIFTYGVVIINDPDLVIPFPDGNLNPSFGWSWWLTLWTGVVITFIGAGILIADSILPYFDIPISSYLAVIFHHSVAADDQFFVADEEEEVPKLEEYGVGATGFHRGAVGRSSRGRTRRGLKQRSTVRSKGGSRHGGNQHAAGETQVETIQLEEVTPKE